MPGLANLRQEIQSPLFQGRKREFYFSKCRTAPRKYPPRKRTSLPSYRRNLCAINLNHSVFLNPFYRGFRKGIHEAQIRKRKTRSSARAFALTDYTAGRGSLQIYPKLCSPRLKPRSLSKPAFYRFTHL